jgi:AcrR family transcriptional regulator
VATQRGEDTGEAKPSGAGKRRLLEGAVAHVAEHGVGDLTLRGLAAALERFIDVGARTWRA